MGHIAYQIRKCQRAECSLRFPLLKGLDPSEECPSCQGETIIVFEGMIEQENHPAAMAPETRVEAMLDNIRSAWNVGSMFRSADGAGLRHLHLCGITPTPENPRVAKTALGAELAVPWSYHADGVELAHTLKAEGAILWALEDKPNSAALRSNGYGIVEGKIVLIVGNEVSGVDSGILEICDKTLYIPMKGIKRSLNAAVAFGIAAYIISAQT